MVLLYMNVGDCELTECLSCDKSEGVVDVAVKLRDNKRRHVIVLDSEKPVGMISVVDIVNRFVAEGKDFENTNAEDIMTSPIIVKDFGEPLSSAYIDMVKNNLLSCPVVLEGKLKGVLSLHEAMKELAKNGKA